MPRALRHCNDTIIQDSSQCIRGRSVDDRPDDTNNVFCSATLSVRTISKPRDPFI